MEPWVHVEHIWWFEGTQRVSSIKFKSRPAISHISHIPAHCGKTSWDIQYRYPALTYQDIAAIPFETNPHAILTVLTWYPPSTVAARKAFERYWWCLALFCCEKVPQEIPWWSSPKAGSWAGYLEAVCSVRWVKALGHRVICLEWVMFTNWRMKNCTAAQRPTISGLGSACSLTVLALPLASFSYFSQFFIPLLIRSWLNSRTNDFQDCDIRLSLASSKRIPWPSTEKHTNPFTLMCGFVVYWSCIHVRPRGGISEWPCREAPGWGVILWPLSMQIWCLNFPPLMVLKCPKQSSFFFPPLPG